MYIYIYIHTYIYIIETYIYIHLCVERERLRVFVYVRKDIWAKSQGWLWPSLVSINCQVHRQKQDEHNARGEQWGVGCGARRAGGGRPAGWKMRRSAHPGPFAERRHRIWSLSCGLLAPVFSPHLPKIKNISIYPSWCPGRPEAVKSFLGKYK